MSEARELNDSSSPDPAHREIEDLLRSLVPRQPAIDRDALFFQAGLAAAGQTNDRGRLARAVWPALAASLLVACGGLTVALSRKSTALDAALAAVAPTPTGAIVSGGTRVDQEAAQSDPQSLAAISPPSESIEGGRFGSLPRSSRLEQVSSPERLPGSQLTAHGWVKAHSGSAWEVEPAPRVEPELRARPARLPAYLELIRAERG